MKWSCPALGAALTMCGALLSVSASAQMPWPYPHPIPGDPFPIFHSDRGLGVVVPVVTPGGGGIPVDIKRGFRRNDVRLGTAFRFASPGFAGADVWGASALMQQNVERGHQRLVVGADFAGRWGEASLQHFVPTTDWRPGRAGYEERALGGTEASLWFQPDAAGNFAYGPVVVGMKHGEWIGGEYLQAQGQKGEDIWFWNCWYVPDDDGKSDMIEKYVTGILEEGPYSVDDRKELCGLGVVWVPSR